MFTWHELDNGEIILVNTGYIVDEFEEPIMRLNNRDELIELLDSTNSIDLLEAPFYAANGFPLVRRGDSFFYNWTGMVDE